jgi:hypothetical protein
MNTKLLIKYGIYAVLVVGAINVLLYPLSAIYYQIVILILIGFLAIINHAIME